MDIVLPVYHGNLHEIRPAVEILLGEFSHSLTAYEWRLVIGINGANQEEILALAQELSTERPNVAFSSVSEPGKGHGVLNSWMSSKADIVAYMDVDLAADITSFPELLGELDNGFDLSIGSRFHPDSSVQRGRKRRFVSSIYHKYFMPIVLGSKDYSDSQCGFKAINRRCIEELLPQIRNRSWFWESEMLYIAQRKGFRIREIPVRWVESEFSGLVLYKAIFEFLGCSLRLRIRRL